MTAFGEHTGLEKVKLTSSDLTSSHIESIGKLFPQVLTEERDASGQLRRAIDFDKLKTLLSHDLSDGRGTYEFTWVGKRDAMAEAGRPTTKTLRPDLDESVDFDKSENVFITGDNLEVLKLLQESYRNKVDMIYIDPPYNTGKDFVYSDKFQQSEDELDEALDLRDDQGRQRVGLKKNEKTSARYHSDWLNMMYPRLVLARNLLKETGVIFISIDDNEQANLKQLCDEVFGEENFITQFIWEKTQHFGRQKLNYYNNADYILSYSNNLFSGEGVRELLIEYIKEDFEDAPLYNASNTITRIRFPALSVKFNISDGEYERTTDEKYTLKNSVIVQNGFNKNDFELEFCSRWSNQKVQDELSKGTVFWVKTENFAIRAIYPEGKTFNESPRQIIFTNSNNPSRTLNKYGNKIDTSEVATKYINNLLGKNLFSYPKPSSLLTYFISIYNSQMSDNILILDFFAGSATTADAVMQLNAEDGGHRKYILCTLDEAVADKSAAKEAGYETIDQISRERIRRAAAKIQEEHPELVGKQDFGFKAYHLDSSNFKEVSQTPDSYQQQDLFESVSTIKEDRSDLDLLIQIMLGWGMELSLTIRPYEIEGCQVYDVDDASLVACFADDISETVIKQMAQKEPLRAVFRDDSFATSADKINLAQIFKELSPGTKVKVV